MQEYQVPEFTVMSISATSIKASQEFEGENNVGAGSIFGPNVGGGK